MSEKQYSVSPGWIQFLIGLVLLFFIAALVVPNFVPNHRRQSSAQNACINNLRQIDGAKDQWAIEHHRHIGDMVEATNVAAYIKGDKLPTCPGGGTYTVGLIGEVPTCSLGSKGVPHRLPSSPNTCVDNLRDIYIAKVKWSRVKNTNAVVIAPKDVVQFLNNHVLPTCPDGGTYNLKDVGEAPTCSLGSSTNAEMHMLKL